RHRDRHDSGAAGQVVRGVHPGRCHDCTAFRRHGTRPCHHPQARAPDGRRRDRDQRAGQRFGVHGAPAGRREHVNRQRGRVQMKLPRRNFLHLAAGAAALPAVSRVAWAQAYPMRPVRIIVGFPAGLGPDITARLIAQLLSEKFGQSFIVDNRPGAGSNIGTEIVVRAAADGYTLLLMTASNAINATVYDNLNFDFIRAVAPVASVGVVPFLMLVNPSFPAQTISEFIAYAKAHPAKVNMGSAGYGSAPHMFGELFKMMTGIDLVHIPYRDNYWPDLLAGQTQILFAPVISATGYVQSGQLRALAVTTRTRLEAMPAIPALDEFVPGYEASGWLGVGAPKNTPVEIIDKLNNEINVVLADAKAKSRLADVGVVLMPMAPDELGKFIAADTEKWAKVVKFAGVKLQ